MTIKKCDRCGSIEEPIKNVKVAGYQLYIDDVKHLKNVDLCGNCIGKVKAIMFEKVGDE